MQLDITAPPLPPAEVTGANLVTLKEITWAEVNLDAIACNVRAIKNFVGQKVEVIAVVKANAYGHGAVPVARAALESGATRLAVHRLVEGVELRQAGLTAPVLILGYTLPAEAETVARWNLTPTVNELVQAESLAAVSHRGKRLPVHVKVDTGLGRFGLLPEKVVPFCRALLALPGLELEGCYTHFAVADETSSESSGAYTRCQLDIYLAALEALAAHGIAVPLRHAANSAALLAFPDSHLDAVRPGIVLYGLSPFSNGLLPIPLQPALTLKSRVVRLRMLPAGVGIGYGRTFITQHPTRVALVPVGYGDGYHRFLSSRGQVLVHGQRTPILGRVSMDQVVVDVSAIPGVKQHDEVVFFGCQTGDWGQATLPAKEVAAWAETINYEMTTALLPRVTRVYWRRGGVAAVHKMGDSSSICGRMPS